MKYYTSFLFLFIFLLGLSSCEEEPEFALEPYLVGFDGQNGIRFVDAPNTVVDSLIIRVVFQDGDGNLGLYGNESDPLFRQEAFPDLDQNGDYIRYDFNIHGPYDCTKFKSPPIYIGQDTILDTLQVKYNPYYYNFDVAFLIKDGGEFQEYDWRKERCSAPLGGRFSPLKEDFNNTKPLEGVIQYGFGSAAIKSFFRNDTVKMRVRIRDRALNESNEIESDPFVLVDEGIVYVED